MTNNRIFTHATMCSLISLFLASSSLAVESQPIFEASSVQKRLKHYSHTSTTKNGESSIPRGKLLKHVYESHKLELKIISKVKTAETDGDAPIMTEMQSNKKSFTSKRAENTLKQMCGMAKKMRESGDIDGYALSLLGQQAQQEENEDMESYYERKISLLPKSSREKINKQIESSNITYSNVDFVGLASEMPDVVFSLIENGCKREYPKL